MGKQRYWGGHGRAAASIRKLKNGGDDEQYHREEATSSAGCMCAVFQLFDFHPLNQHHQQPQSPATFKPISLPPDDHISTGTEAPRNSLQSDEEVPLSRPAEPEGDDLHIPMGIVQIKTRSRSNESPSGGGNANDYSSNSPGTKTPTLVARLMGLDLLPQTNSPATTPRTATASPNYPLLPKPKSRNFLAQTDNLIIGPRSLPETPRTSCERKSNVDNYHHRLSLQIPNYDKENTSPSPSHYAREIVKQVKESVSRKAGLDITNYTRRDEAIIQTKPKKISSSPGTSPRVLRTLEPKNLNKPSPKIETSKANPGKKVKTTKPLVQISTDGEQKRSKKEVHEKFGRPAKIVKRANKQEEPFVIPSRITKATNDSPRKKCKKTLLSNDLLNFSSVPTVLMKKDSSTSSAKVPQMQVCSPCNGNQPAEASDNESKRYLQLSSFQNQPHKTMHAHVIQPKKDGSKKHHIKDAATTASISTTASDCSNNLDITAEVEYVREILSRTSTPVYSIFLENNNEVSISQQSDRKLLAHLVEELLKPYVEMRPWAGVGTVGSGCCHPVMQRWPDPELVEKLCGKVRSYPRAKCQVLEDIDGIIEKDLDRFGIQVGSDDEGEGMVKEIEKGIVEDLLCETVGLVCV